jgi:hypothetical protein
VFALEIADTEVPDFSRALQGLECIECLFQRDILAPVQKIQVEVVGFEPLEAVFVCRKQA